MRSPITAFKGEYLARIGHNQGPPLDAGQSWRAFAWKKARKKLVPRLPLEIVRRRVARAKELGLEYPQYASILLGTGRDIVGFLFTCDALGLRLGRGVEMPENVQKKLSALGGCERILMTDKDPLRLHRMFDGASQTRFGHISATPARDCTWTEGKAAVQAALSPLKLPGDAVVMIGTRTQERTWADAARLAKFFPAERYFIE